MQLKLAIGIRAWMSDDGDNKDRVADDDDDDNDDDDDDDDDNDVTDLPWNWPGSCPWK